MADKLIDFQSNRTNVRINPVKRSIIYNLLSLFWMINDNWVQKFIRTNYFAPRKYNLSGTEQELLTKAESSRIIVNGQKIVCWRWGRGPALVFVHGWNGRGIQFQPFIREAMNRGYSAITFDGPGHGDSDGNSSSYFEMTDALRAVLNHFEEKEVIAIIGHSFGASAIINAFHKENLRMPAVLLAPALGIKEMLDTTFVSHGIPRHIYDHLIAIYEQRYGYDLHQDNPRNLLNEYPIRALIIHDIHDKVTSFEDSKTVTAKLPSIKLVATDGLGHKKIINDRQVVAKAYDYLNL